MVYTDFTLCSVFTAKSGIGEVCRLAVVVRSAVRNNKQAVKLSVHQDGGCPRTGILEILETVTIIAEI
jgi:hypothetical protein